MTPSPGATIRPSHALLSSTYPVVETGTPTTGVTGTAQTSVSVGAITWERLGELSPDSFATVGVANAPCTTHAGNERDASAAALDAPCVPHHGAIGRGVPDLDRAA